MDIGQEDIRELLADENDAPTHIVGLSISTLRDSKIHNTQLDLVQILPTVDITIRQTATKSGVNQI